MNKSVTICIKHHAVYNRKKDTWDAILPQTLDRLRLIAARSSIPIDEGCCTRCSAQVLDSSDSIDNGKIKETSSNPNLEEIMTDFAQDISQQPCEAIECGKPLGHGQIVVRGGMKFHQVCSDKGDARLQVAMRIATQIRDPKTNDPSKAEVGQRYDFPTRWEGGMSDFSGK